MKTESSLVAHVRTYCAKHQLFEAGSVVVAVSGGPDSVALLHVLLTLREELNLTLHVATFDHQIRGPEGVADVEFVRNLATAWGLPCIVGSANVPDLAHQKHLGLEEAARQARYEFLAEVALKTRSIRIATGHNRDDQAETVLMHVIRGSGLAGLRGMLPKSPLLTNSTLTLVRPLLESPRSEIEAMLHDLKIETRSDSTNEATTYTRNRLRHEVLPLLESINPAVRESLARTAEIAREDYAALQSSLSALVPSGHTLTVDRATFMELPASQQRMLIQQAVRQLLPGKQATFERVESAIQLTVSHPPGQTATRTIPLIGPIKFGVNEAVIWIGGEVPSSISEWSDKFPLLHAGAHLVIGAPGVLILPGSPWRLLIERGSGLPDSVKTTDPLSALLALDSGSSMVLRTRIGGDRFRPLGMDGHTQKLKETFIDMKTPTHWRDQIPLLTVNDEIAWFVAPTAQGLRARVGERFALHPHESREIWRFVYAREN